MICRRSLHVAIVMKLDAIRCDKNANRLQKIQSRSAKLLSRNEAQKFNNKKISHRTWTTSRRSQSSVIVMQLGRNLWVEDANWMWKTRSYLVKFLDCSRVSKIAQKCNFGSSYMKDSLLWSNAIVSFKWNCKGDTNID